MSAGGDFDLFYLFRGSLALVCVTYATVRAMRALGMLLAPPNPDHPHETWMRRYLTLQLLRVQFRAFAPDVLQLAALVTLFCYLITRHS